MSFRLVDKVKKSKLPGALKAVLEAYLSFGDKDGTSIRPTAAKVAVRAGKSQSTVHHLTPELVRLGLLVHDRDEKGEYLRHDYGKHGAWAYVYHADLGALENPGHIAYWELKRQVVSDKRRAASKAKEPLQLCLFGGYKFTETGIGKIADPGSGKFAETRSGKIADRPDPMVPALRSVTDQTPVDPSAAGAAGREVSKQASEAEGAPRPELPDTEEQHQTFYWSERHGREFSIEEVHVASEYLMALFPRSDLGEKDTVLMAEIALDFLQRYPDLKLGDGEDFAPSPAETRVCRRMSEYLAWNRTHKKGGLVHANVAEFHNAWFSENDRCARNQWEDHDPAECPKCKALGVDSHAEERRANARDREIVRNELSRRAAASGTSDTRAVGRGFFVEEAE
jgi:hypothetical protein